MIVNVNHYFQPISHGYAPRALPAWNRAFKDGDRTTGVFSGDQKMNANQAEMDGLVARTEVQVQYRRQAYPVAPWLGHAFLDNLEMLGA